MCLNSSATSSDSQEGGQVIEHPYLVEVVTYDPVRRQGFMRLVESTPVRTVVFHTRDLPSALRKALIIAGKRVDRARKVCASPKEWRQLMREVRSLILHHRFRLEVRWGRDGHGVIVRNSTLEVS